MQCKGFPLRFLLFSCTDWTNPRFTVAAHDDTRNSSEPAAPLSVALLSLESRRKKDSRWRFVRKCTLASCEADVRTRERPRDSEEVHPVTKSRKTSRPETQRGRITSRQPNVTRAHTEPLF